jgi:pimeloyl-ACP methyl ester carboxylesterase
MRLAALAFALAALAGSAHAQTSPLAPYEQPGQLAAVGPGRAVNLVCQGQGAPTVILSAGLVGWSIDWVRVQPVVARKTRVCAWDRPGQGYSTASPGPQDLRHVEADLERALDAARIAGPLVLAGHSAGALESLAFADRHPDRVAGLVLVDPSFPDQQARLAKAAPALMAFSGQSDRAFEARVEACIQDLRRAPGQAAPETCTRLRAGLPDTIRRGLAARTADPDYWATFLASYRARDRNPTLAVNPRRSYGATPIAVLIAGRLPLPGAPADVQAQAAALQAEGQAGKQALAALSTHGTWTLVPDAAHAIQMQKPAPVIEAIERLVDQARAATP